MAARDKIRQLKAALLKGIYHYESVPSYFGYSIGLIAQVWRQLIAHKFLQQASSLAFTTLICLVPLSAVALVLLKILGVVENEESKLIVYLRDNFLPSYQAGEIARKISEFANTNQGRLSVWGFLFLLIISMAMFNSVEKIFNDIWGARRRPSPFLKFAKFYTIVTIGPLLIGFSISASTNWLFAHLLPWLIMYLLFLLMYRDLPNTEVLWKPALVGTLIAGTLFQIARIVFGNYLDVMGTKYSETYGVLALLAILAIWFHMAWVIIILGAEITNVVQNLKRGNFQEVTGRFMTPTVGDDAIVFVNPILAVKMFLTVAEHFHQGRGSYPKSHLILKYGLPPHWVDGTFKRLNEEGLIYEVEGDTNGYIPARPLNDITLDQLLDAFEGNRNGFTQDDDTFPESVETLLGQLRAVRYEILQSRSIEELIAPTTPKKIYPA